jgi:hypothetical protein
VFNNVSLVKFSKYLHNKNSLKTLKLGGCRNVDDSSFISFCINTKNLEFIDLSNSKITNASLIEISVNCLNLKILKLLECFDITDIGCTAIIKNCLKLEILDLHGCVMISDLTLLRMGKYSMNLKILEATGCEKFTILGLRKLFKNCLLLEDLCFSSLELNDLTLFELSKYCLNLKRLDLSNCYYITDEGLIEIGKKCLKLEYIDTSNCELLTDAGLSLFVLSCKNLKEFDFSSSKFADLNAIRLHLKALNL